MKKRLARIFFFLFACTSVARAELEAPDVQKVPCSRNLPASVKKWMPRLGRHRFFGASKLTYNGRPVFVHIYDANKTDFSENRAQYGANNYAPAERKFQVGHLSVSEYGVQRIEVSLFVSDSRNKRIFKRISTNRFSYIRYEGSRETISVNTLWLNPERKTIPSITIDFRDPEGVLGSIGTEMLLAFSSGLAGKASTIGFGYGADNSSSNNSWFSKFEDEDGKGVLTIKSTQASFGEETTTVYTWNGKFFVTAKH